MKSIAKWLAFEVNHFLWWLKEQLLNWKCFQVTKLCTGLHRLVPSVHLTIFDSPLKREITLYKFWTPRYIITTKNEQGKKNCKLVWLMESWCRHTEEPIRASMLFHQRENRSVWAPKTGGNQFSTPQNSHPLGLIKENECTALSQDRNFQTFSSSLIEFNY